MGSQNDLHSFSHLPELLDFPTTVTSKSKLAGSMKLHSDVGYNHEGITCTYFLITFSFSIQLKQNGE